MPFTTTVQNIVDGTSQDVRKILDSTTNPGQSILIDYTNRVHQQILRSSRWKFLWSPVQRFVTRLGVTDYWFGTPGSGPTTAVDTGLNLTDVEFIKAGSVFDRSNFRALERTEEPPLNVNLEYPDNTSRLDRPRVWRYAPETPSTLNIYPAPNNENDYQPVPEAPICTTSVGGALANRIYYVRVTLLDSLGGESAASGVTNGVGTEVFVPAGSLLVVNPPQVPLAASGVLYNQYNVYASIVAGSEVLQTVTPLSTGVAWTEPITGLIAGNMFPTSSNIEPIDGYLIEFRYFKQRTPLTTTGQVIQIPDDYKDVVVSGVNYYAFRYLNRPEYQEWKQMYAQGVSSMIRDKNLAPSGNQYISPDPASIGNQLPSIEVLDPSLLRDGSTN